MKITLFHGSDCLFDDVDLSKSLGSRDFGIGFYTTTISSQAENWAKSKRIRNGSEHAYVYVFEAEINDNLLVKKYDRLSVEWLEMIKNNRKLGGIQHSYDVMIGPVANDNTMVTVNRYIQGVYTAEEAISRLEYANVNDQVSFHTKKAVDCLSLVRRYQIE